MKIRLGFVSNSSSTSFYFEPDKVSIEEVRRIIENFLGTSEYRGTCTVYETDDTSGIIKDLAEYKAPCVPSGRGEGLTWDQAELKRKNLCLVEERKIAKTFPRRIIVVDSYGDNSIPGKLQDLLEDIAYMRQHWG